MDRTKEFTQLLCSHMSNHEETNEKPQPRKSLVRDIQDEYTQEAYRIVYPPYSPSYAVVRTHQFTTKLPPRNKTSIHANRPLANSIPTYRAKRTRNRISNRHRTR